MLRPATSPVYDPELPWSLCFAGCGFLGLYHVGATRCLAERAPQLLRNAPMFFSNSAGSLHVVCFLSGLSLDQQCKVFLDMNQACRRLYFGPWHPSFLLSEFIRDKLYEYLPDNAHQLISGKMCISLTRVSDGKNVLVSEFNSKEDVVDAVVCSCFVPFYSGIIPPSFRGERYIDGGFTDNAPFLDTKRTIILSPYCGESDICPKEECGNFFYLYMFNHTYKICLRNVHWVCRTFLPSDPKMLAEDCLRGYLDAYRFLVKNGFCTSPKRALNLSSEEMEPEVTPSRENKSEERAELLDPLRLSPVTWDPKVLETLSPKLTAALSEAMRDSTGLGRSHDLLPVRILSYGLLLCTLPMELAIATVHRLVRWLPDFPEDILLLHWVISKLCGHVMTCLLPFSRDTMRLSRSRKGSNEFNRMARTARGTP